MKWHGKICLALACMFSISGCSLKYPFFNVNEGWSVVPVGKEFSYLPEDFSLTFFPKEKKLEVHSKCISDHTVYGFNSGKFSATFNNIKSDSCLGIYQKQSVDNLFNLLKDGVVLRGEGINNIISFEKDNVVKIQLRKKET
ncbi:MxiM family type III secretion system pilotin [Escherichia coli]